MRIVACSCTAFLWLAASIPAYGVMASPDLHSLEQHGGRFAARQWGDEYVHGWETESGYTVVRNETTAVWEYAARDGAGRLAASGKIVGRDNPPEKRHVRPHHPDGARGGAAKKLFRYQKKTAAGGDVRQYATGAGTADITVAAKEISVMPPSPFNLPVLLVNFANTTATYTPGDWQLRVFGVGVPSLREYYRENSKGQLDVVGGEYGVTGWYTVSGSHDYYGSDLGCAGRDCRVGELVRDVVQLADDVLDFAEYVNGEDCVVDELAIIHQGTGQEASGVATDIWSHSSDVGSFVTNDRCRLDPERNVVVSSYIIMPEKRGNTIHDTTIINHEFGHSLGLPDLYDTDYTSFGAGSWSSMANSWAGVHLDAWSKYRLGWVTPLVPEPGTITITAGAASGDVYRFGTDENEFFLVENRQPTGYDAGLPGSGLAVWHIYEQGANTNEWYPGCASCNGWYRVGLVQADNRYDLERRWNQGDGGDPYPGTANRTAFGATTAPTSQLHSGQAAGFELTNISAAATTMTATVSIWQEEPPRTTITAPGCTNNPQIAFTFERNVPGTSQCKVGEEDYAPCESPYEKTVAGDGKYVFYTYATDMFDNVESPPQSREIYLQRVPPVPVISEAPAPRTAATDARFVIGMASGLTAGTVTHEYQLDGGPWTVAATGEIVLAGLGSGEHVFRVRLTDCAGNTSVQTVEYAWTVDVTAPVVSVSSDVIDECGGCSSPVPATKRRMATVAFVTNEEAGFICSLRIMRDGYGETGREWPCVSPVVLTDLADGLYELGVTATDAVGNSGRTVYTWRVDTTAPVVAIVGRPASPSYSALAIFTFAANDALGGAVSYRCQMDGQLPYNCSNPATLAGLTDGWHTLHVRGVDGLGNETPDGTSYSWFVGFATPPHVALIAGGEAIHYYGTLAAALAAVPAGDSTTLQVQGVVMDGGMTIDTCSDIVVSGGHTSTFSQQNGQTTIRGTVTVGCGSLTVDNVVIR